MKSKETQIKYKINNNGNPVIEASEKSYVSVEITEQMVLSTKQQIPTVEIIGNRKGLIDLAKWLVALADEDSQLDHQHFDNEINFGFFKETKGVQLIVNRVGK